MNTKKILKILVDVLMYVDFLFLMNHGTIRILNLHGIFGILLFILFIFHHFLNFWFYRIANKGRWNGKRILLNITDWILFILMILMAASSVMMSGLVFEWSHIPSLQIFRVFHLMSTSWCFLVMNFHLALHVITPLKKLEGRCKSRLQKTLFQTVMILIFTAGSFCFFKTQLYVYMFNLSGWKAAASDALTGFVEYIGITAGICSLVEIIRHNSKS